MWCPYNCPRDDTETITNHFQRVHSHRIIKNDCYSILTQPSFAHRQFLLNNRTNGTFLSKCNTIGDEKITFSTTCLTAKNPVKYELIFYAQPHGNPTLTRRLQTIEFDEMCDSNHDETILDLRYICEKVGGCAVRILTGIMVLLQGINLAYLTYSPYAYHHGMRHFEKVECCTEVLIFVLTQCLVLAVLVVLYREISLVTPSDDLQEN